MIEKVTLKTLKNVYGRSHATGKELVFNRLVYDDTKKNVFGDTGYKETIGVGDEIVIAYKTGGSYRGWFIGTGNVEDSYVALCWFPYFDTFELVYITSKPIPCNWTHLVNMPSVLKAKDQVETLRHFTGNNFIFELQL